MNTPFAKIRFLLVDDNVHMLNIVRALLRGFGAVTIFEARNSQDALQRLRNDAIDIMILDYVIGEEDGVEFLKRVRREQDSPTPFVPVIMLTAHTERTRVEAARDAGVNEFCTKPVTANDMLRKVSMVIEHARPFVRSQGYFGPDRRRRADDGYSGPDRRNPPSGKS